MESFTVLNTIVGGIIGLFCGASTIWIWQKNKIKNLKLQMQNADFVYNQHIETLKKNESMLNNELANAKNTLQLIESGTIQRIEDMQKHCEARILEEKERSTQIFQHLQKQYTFTQEELQKREERNKEELKNAFKAISADILRVNTQNFNQNQLVSLQPLKEDIQRFSKQLKESYEIGIMQHTALKTQIEELHKLNTQLSTDAHNLTNALKGENKIQGNWGEVILQKVLENSGLQKGREYELQANMHDEQNQMLRPDAIIKLPKHNGEERCVVIDAKTSLTAYERLCNAQNEQEKKVAQKELRDSIKKHFSGLSKKNYQDYLNGQKLDFVLMFIPIEGAFLETMHFDNNIYDEAHQKGVVLTSPTTIMAVLKIIHNLWQFEYRNKNIDKIFLEIQKLFKGISRFDKELESLGKNIITMQKTYEEVMTKYNGNQGIAKKSENIQHLLKGAGHSLEDSLINSDTE